MRYIPTLFSGTSAVAATGVSQMNIMGLVGCEAAYTHGREWYEAVRDYIYENILFTKRYIDEKLPQLKMSIPEGTYLVWIDCRGLGLGKKLDRFILEKAGLWLDDGSIFGEVGEGFERINVACPRETLKLALDKLKYAIDGLKVGERGGGKQL